MQHWSIVSLQNFKFSQSLFIEAQETKLSYCLVLTQQISFNGKLFPTFASSNGTPIWIELLCHWIAEVILSPQVLKFVFAFIWIWLNIKCRPWEQNYIHLHLYYIWDANTCIAFRVTKKLGRSFHKNTDYVYSMSVKISTFNFNVTE